DRGARARGGRPRAGLRPGGRRGGRPAAARARGRRRPLRRRGRSLHPRAAHRVGPVPVARLRARRRRDGCAAASGRRPEPARPRRHASPRVRVRGRGALMPRAVVTGGAGFLGSHLCRTLRGRGWDVVAVDNLLTGHRANLDDLLGPGFELVEHNVSRDLPVDGSVDAVLHFASAASPPEYLAHPIETLEVGANGTRHALDVARGSGARFLLASTSEIYGDPLVHPQPESYWGNVNSIGPRAVYDEAKRYAE